MAEYVKLDNLYQGDTQIVEVTVTDDDGNAVDLDAEVYTIWYTVKTTTSNDAELYQQVKSTFIQEADDPSNGVCVFYVPNDTTADWDVRSMVYDIVTEHTIDTSTVIHNTYQWGAFNVLQPVHNDPVPHPT